MPRAARPLVRRAALPALAAALLVPLVAACGSDDKKDSGASGDGKKNTTLTVLAAASLTDVFKQAGAAYEKEHPGVKVKFSYAGSQELASQVRQGVPADALVTADTKTMDGLKSDTETPSVIAKNRLTIVTGKGNPKKVKGLSDLAKSDLKVVLAAPQVPVGRYSKKVLDKQHIAVKPASQEPNVRAVLTKVELGEADAGIVYATDAAVAGKKVATVDVPDDQNAIASYPAAVLKGSKHSSDAASFVKWLNTDESQKLLRAAGFQKP
ncbi:molybdate ABC transporter substrate-binding protein [Streptomyces sp. NPDC050617]|uniref:molybdate ABC transporter substrate-binding protein n=1 Tax=Streptomyces sp. NPDC050617 TaxID=3154628 RepID=UPI00341BA710